MTGTPPGPPPCPAYIGPSSPTGVSVDTDFIRRSVTASDLAALRATVYQSTHDPVLARLGPVAALAPEQRQELVERCTHLIATQLDSWPSRTPDDAEMRHIMDLILGKETSDGDFVVRRGVLAFEDHPFQWMWPDRRHTVPEGFEVAIVGAGLSGLAMGVQLQLLGIPYVIYERRHEMGGTWSRHTYPDIRVDTASVTYEYSFEKLYPWSEYFARGPEVRGYIEHVARKWGVLEHVAVDHDLQSATFDETTDTWHLVLRRSGGGTVTRSANALVTAMGVFANPRHFDAPGLSEFEGAIVHPTRWPADLDLSGKRVAVIGNGSTGVQLLAPVAEQSASVHVFQRTAQWISPRTKYGQPMEPEVRWLFEHVPGYWNWTRFTSIMNLFSSEDDFLTEDPDWKAQGGLVSEKSDQLRAFLTGYIKAQTDGRPELYERLIPDYPPMLRRPVVDNGWYRALTRDNVELVTDPIARFTPRGILTADGRERAVDVVVTATGFDVVKFLWPARFTGVGGVDLHQRWAEEDPRAYASLMVPGFPNFFMLYGPNSQPVGGGVSLPNWYVIWSSFVAQCLTTLIDERLTRAEVTEAAFWAYNERLDAEGAKLALVTDETSRPKNYYVNESGRIQVNCTLRTADFYSYVHRPDRDDIKYS